MHIHCTGKGMTYPYSTVFHNRLWVPMILWHDGQQCWTSIASFTTHGIHEHKPQPTKHKNPAISQVMAPGVNDNAVTMFCVQYGQFMLTGFSPKLNIVVTCCGCCMSTEVPAGA